MKLKKWWFIVAVMLVSFVLLSACGSGGSGNGEATSAVSPNAQDGNHGTDQDGTGENGTEEVVEIRFPWWGNVERHNRYNALMDMFEEQHPHIRVIREPLSFSDYWDRLATQTAGGNPPDVLMFTRGQLSEYVSRGAVLALDEYIENGLIDMSDYAESARRIGEYQGSIYMVTKGMSAPATFVNVDLLERKGIRLPEYEMTWDEFTDYLYEIEPLLGETEDGRKIYALSDPSSDEAPISSFMRQRGYELFTEDGKSLAFGKEDLKEWFSYWQKLREDGIIPPAEIWAEEGGLDWEQGPIATNRIAMEFGRASNNLINLQQVMEDNIDLIRVPTDPNGVNKYGEIIMGANIGISAHSKHPEAVAQLINFWLNDLEFNKLYNNDHGITGNKRLLEEWDLPPTTREVSDHLQDVLATIEPQKQRPPGQTAFFNQLSRSHEEIYFGVKSIDEAVEDVFREAEKILN